MTVNAAFFWHVTLCRLKYHSMYVLHSAMSQKVATFRITAVRISYCTQYYDKFQKGIIVPLYP
jgi:hypothetical protein